MAIVEVKCFIYNVLNSLKKNIMRTKYSDMVRGPNFREKTGGKISDSHGIFLKYVGRRAYSESVRLDLHLASSRT